MVTPATGGLYDIRSLNTLKLNDNLLDDTKVFFKDRDSTDAVSNPVLGKVTFKDRIHGDEDLTLSTDKSLGIGFAETDNIASGLQVHIKGGQNRGTFKLEQTYAGWASKLYLKNDTNEWGLFSDASPDEFRIGRVTTTGEIASSVNKDISIDGSTGDVTIGENLAVDGNASITGTSHVSDDATFANGVGIGYTDSEDVTNGQLKLKTGTGDGVISITTSDVVGHAKLSLKTSSGTDFDIQATDSGSLSIGRVSQSDLVIDSSGTFFIGEAFVALKSGSVAGTFTAGDNLKVDQTNNQVILGREATTLATTDTDSEVIIGSKGGNLKTNLHILTE